jgi:hypothetical protein
MLAWWTSGRLVVEDSYESESESDLSSHQPLLTLHVAKKNSFTLRCSSQEWSAWVAHLVVVPNPRRLRTPPKPGLGSLLLDLLPVPRAFCTRTTGPGPQGSDKIRGYRQGLPGFPGRKRKGRVKRGEGGGVGGGSEMAPHVHRTARVQRLRPVVLRPASYVLSLAVASR